MKNVFNKLIWLVMASPAVYLAIIWKKLPEKVAMHFNLEGKADRYGHKSELITMMVIMMVVNVAVYLLLTNIHRIDPKKNAATNQERMNRIAWATAFLLSAIQCLIVFSSLKSSIEFGVNWVLSGIALFLAFIGNYLPSLKPNYFAGIRLPWTLEDEDNWRKTHRLAGKLFFYGGLVLAGLCLFLHPKPAIIVFLTTILAISIICCVYSFRYYKLKKQNRGTPVV